MTRDILWTVPLTVAFAFCAGPVRTQERDVEQMIDDLEMPRIGSFSFQLSFTGQMLGEKPSPQEAAREIGEIRRRIDAGEATPVDWPRLVELHQGPDGSALANQAHKQGVQACRDVLEEHPDDVDALVALGRLLTQPDEAAEAEALIRRALELSPDRLEAYPALSTALLRQANPFTLWTQRLLEQHPDAMAALGYREDNPPDITEPSTFVQLQQRLAEKAAELNKAATEITRQPLSPEELAPLQAAGERAEQWIAEARPRLLQALQDKPTPELFGILMETETSAAWAVAGAAMAAAIGEGADVQALQQQAAERTLFALMSPTVVQAGERLCEGRPDDLRLRGLVGRLQLMHAFMGAMKGAALEGGEFVLPDARQLAPARQNLEAAMALPVEGREGVTPALVALYLLLGEGEAAIKTTEEMIEAGQWDYSAVSAALIAALEVSLIDLIQDEPDLPDDKMPRLESLLARWIDRAKPEEPVAYASLALARTDLGRWEEAVAPLERACELAPASLKYAYGLGVVHLNLGDHEKAEQVLRAATAMKADDPETMRKCHHALGIALLALGRPEEAEAEFHWK